MRFCFLAFVLLIVGNVSGERLISEGDAWRYYKGLSTPPVQGALDWTQPAYSESGWEPPSPSGFGYGDGDDATAAFTDMQHAYWSVYVRKSFAVANPAAITRLTLAVDYDDGFVAYVNGVEVARRNMPAGTIAHNTPASSAHEASRGGGAENPQEKEFIEIDPALLVAGTNVVALSGHNRTLESSDFTLRPELFSNVTLVRGPFLQMPTAGRISIVWRTDALTDSVIDYGTDTNYTGGSVTDLTLTRQHLATLPVLPTDAAIHYRVRSGGVTLAESVLYPPRVNGQVFRFAVYGDFGWGNDATGNLAAAPGAVAAQVVASDPHLTLTVGDNIYNNGQPGLHDPYWFTPYGPVNRRAPLFPALGNHDVDNSSNGQPFIDFFALPPNGPAGFLERTYSFDYGNAHFAVVDVNPFVFKIDTAAQTAIKNWLASDLAASTQRWKFVFFHQPAYTSSGSGVHSPAAILQNELQPIFAQHGVQLVFQGHNHFYERINPINGVNYITTGGGGRGLTTPTVLPTYSAVVKSAVYSFTQVDLNGGQLTLRQIDASGAQIDSFSLNLDHAFRMNGLLDSTAYQRAANANGLKLHAAIRGNFLYLATQDAGEGSDHFIYLHNQVASPRAANWSKAGQVMTWSAFLADENETGFKGWFGASEELLTDTARYSATTSGLNNNGPTGNGVLEGTIDLTAHFGAFPAQIYLAAAPFASSNGGALQSSAQVPAGNGNGDLEPNEFLILNTRDIALDLPTASAGADQRAEAGMQVVLAGTGNSPSGLVLSHSWSQFSGPSVTINNADQLTASFVSASNVAQTTELTFQLRVNDTRFDTDDSIIIQFFPMLDSDGDGLSDQEELTGRDNGLTSANPGGNITNPNLADSDGDGANDGSEALAGTNPNSAASLFRIMEIAENGDVAEVTFASVVGRSYRAQMKTDLPDDWIDTGDLVTATSGVTSIPVPAAQARGFYRVRLSP